MNALLQVTDQIRRSEPTRSGHLLAELTHTGVFRSRGNRR